MGDDYRECLKTGYWSGEEPICKSNDFFHYILIIIIEAVYASTCVDFNPLFVEIIWCPDLDNPEYGRVDQNGNKLGSTAYYECNKGFKLVGDEYRECLYTGYWNGKKPVCKRKCKIKLWYGMTVLIL